MTILCLKVKVYCCLQTYLYLHKTYILHIYTLILFAENTCFTFMTVLWGVESADIIFSYKIVKTNEVIRLTDVKSDSNLLVFKITALKLVAFTIRKRVVLLDRIFDYYRYMRNRFLKIDKKSLQTEK